MLESKSTRGGRFLLWRSWSHHPTHVLPIAGMSATISLNGATYKVGSRVGTSKLLEAIARVLSTLPSFVCQTCILTFHTYASPFRAVVNSTSGQITAIVGKKARVHWDGFSSKWDEWVEATSLAPDTSTAKAPLSLPVPSGGGGGSTAASSNISASSSGRSGAAGGAGTASAASGAGASSSSSGGGAGGGGSSSSSSDFGERKAPMAAPPVQASATCWSCSVRDIRTLVALEPIRVQSLNITHTQLFCPLL